MTTSETYAWCLFFAFGLLAWLAAGPAGWLCLVAGMIVSHVEVGWIDEHLARREAALNPQPDPEPGETAPAPVAKKTRKRPVRLPPNVIPLRRKAS